MNNTYSWYSHLKKPSWAPPNWVFGPVWTFLYILIAISFGKVFISYPQQSLPFVLNIIFNVIFTPIQFGLKNNLLAAIDISIILLTLIWAIITIYPFAPWLAYLQAPYLIWVCIATVLQFSVTYLNISPRQHLR